MPEKLYDEFGGEYWRAYFGVSSLDFETEAEAEAFETDN